MKEFPYRFISIEGCIGAGKTSFAKLLSNDFNGKLLLEQFEENDFLVRFYKNPERYAFPLELSFLAARFMQFKENIVDPDLFSNYIFSDYIFPKSLIFSRKTLQEDEYRLYRSLFQIIDSNLQRPDLVVYLHLSPEKLKENIVKRGRDYEQEISLEYLDSIQKSYFEYFKENSNLRVLVVDTEGLDFIANIEHYNFLVSLLKKEYSLGMNFAERFM